jgi:hypothetical protein
MIKDSDIPVMRDSRSSSIFWFGVTETFRGTLSSVLFGLAIGLHCTTCGARCQGVFQLEIVRRTVDESYYNLPY